MITIQLVLLHECLLYVCSVFDVLMPRCIANGFTIAAARRPPPSPADEQKRKRTELAERIQNKLHAAFWMAVGGLVAYHTDFFKVMFEDKRVNSCKAQWSACKALSADVPPLLLYAHAGSGSTLLQQHLARSV
eukprot:5807-Heterococcus_DN1.PRE.1